MSKLCNRGAISPAITTLILIGVAVLAGLGSYSAYNSASSVATIKGIISVENLQLIKSSTGEEYLSVTLKNSGNKYIQSVVVNLQTDTNQAMSGIQPFSITTQPAALSPGQTASAYSRVNLSDGSPMVSHNIGDNIPLEVVATTPDGSTVRTTTSVTVSIS